MILPRRTFLTGLAAALCTPAVVRAGALMPIRALAPFYTRALVMYEIMTDSIILRVDRARFLLPTPDPRCGIYTVPMWKVYSHIPKAMIDSVQPAEGIQQHIDIRLDAWAALCEGGGLAL